jgi:ABC-type sugar transport system permease subunit
LSGIFSASGPILLLVTGQYNTSTVAFWIYNIVQEEGDYNLVATAGLCFTAVIIPIILLVRAFMERFSDVEY